MHFRMTDRFDWNHARAFLGTAETGSLSAAARRLGQSQPTLSRQVAALEAELGVTLFARVGKRLELTRSGLDLLEHVRGMGAAAERMALAASGRAEQVEGLVRITASDMAAVHLLPPLLAGLRARHPGIEVEVIASNALQDLRRREADIAIRNARPAQGDLIARRLAETPAHLYAAPALIARQGPLDSPAALERADWLWLDDPGQMIAYMAGLGLTLDRARFRAGSHDGLSYWAMARAGLGVAAMVAHLARDSAPEMVPLLPARLTIPVPYWLTTHAELQTSRRIRLVYDFLAEAIPPLLR